MPDKRRRSVGSPPSGRETLARDTPGKAAEPAQSPMDPPRAKGKKRKAKSFGHLEPAEALVPPADPKAAEDGRKPKKKRKRNAKSTGDVPSEVDTVDQSNVIESQNAQALTKEVQELSLSVPEKPTDTVEERVTGDDSDEGMEGEKADGDKETSQMEVESKEVEEGVEGGVGEEGVVSGGGMDEDVEPGIDGASGSVKGSGEMEVAKDDTSGNEPPTAGGDMPPNDTTMDTDPSDIPPPKDGNRPIESNPAQQDKHAVQPVLTWEDLEPALDRIDWEEDIVAAEETAKELISRALNKAVRRKATRKLNHAIGRATAERRRLAGLAPLKECTKCPGEYHWREGCPQWVERDPKAGTGKPRNSS